RLPDLSHDVIRIDCALFLRDQEISRLVQGGLAPVDEEARFHDRRGVELAGGRNARADGVDVRARLEPFAGQNRLARGCGRAEDVRAARGVPHGSKGLDLYAVAPRLALSEVSGSLEI